MKVNPWDIALPIPPILEAKLKTLVKRSHRSRRPIQVFKAIMPTSKIVFRRQNIAPKIRKFKKQIWIATRCSTRQTKSTSKREANNSNVSIKMRIQRFLAVPCLDSITSRLLRDKKTKYMPIQTNKAIMFSLQVRATRIFKKYSTKKPNSKT